MILVDTVIWIDYLADRQSTLSRLLDQKVVLSHPFVIGEVALGSLRDRRAVLSGLARLPFATVALDEEVVDVIERHGLNGSGIGYVDAHLLVSTMLTPSTLLWTRDRRLASAAARLDVLASAGDLA